MKTPASSETTAAGHRTPVPNADRIASQPAAAPLLWATSLLLNGLSGQAWADLAPPPPTEVPITTTPQSPFAPTWLEWTLFGVINLIIVAIYIVLWYRGTLRRPQNVFQESPSSKS